MKVKELTKEVVEEAAKVLSDGGIVCFPTDTLYGLLAHAGIREAVERLYAIRRPSGRPFLLLVPDVSWVQELGLLAGDLSMRLMELYNATFIFYKKTKVPLYLTRGRKSLALRIPPGESQVMGLLHLLDAPVVAPSANPEGEKPALNVKEAIEYFGDKVDLYVDGGDRKGKPSTIVRALYPKGLRKVREGSVPFEKILETYRRLRSSPFSYSGDAP